MPRDRKDKQFRRGETGLFRTSRGDRGFDARAAAVHKSQHIDRFLRDCKKTTIPAEPTFVVTTPRTAPQPSSTITIPLVTEQRQTPTTRSQASSVILSLSTVSFVSARKLVEPASKETSNAPPSRHQRRKLRLRKFIENNPDAAVLSRLCFRHTHTN